MSFRILALVTAGFAIQSALRARGEETSTHAEQVLATRMSRTRFVTSHLLIASCGTALILFLEGVTFGVFAAATTSDPDMIVQSLLAALAFVPAVWVVIGLTVALFGVMPRASGLPWAYLGVCFVIGMFGQLLELPQWIVNVSPFQHVPQYPATELRAIPLVALTVLSAGLTALGVRAFGHRDIG
jgi:ABC-2 type transport system permease protein